MTVLLLLLLLVLVLVVVVVVVVVEKVRLAVMICRAGHIIRQTGDAKSKRESLICLTSLPLTYIA